MRLIEDYKLKKTLSPSPRRWADFVVLVTLAAAVLIVGIAVLVVSRRKPMQVPAVQPAPGS